MRTCKCKDWTTKVSYYTAGEWTRLGFRYCPWCRGLLIDESRLAKLILECEAKLNANR